MAPHMFNLPHLYLGYTEEQATHACWGSREVMQMVQKHTCRK